MKHLKIKEQQNIIKNKGQAKISKDCYKGENEILKRFTVLN